MEFKTTPKTRAEGFILGIREVATVSVSPSSVSVQMREMKKTGRARTPRATSKIDAPKSLKVVKKVEAQFGQAKAMTFETGKKTRSGTLGGGGCLCRVARGCSGRRGRILIRRGARV